MLKSPLTFCLCSSFFLLPSSSDKADSGAITLKNPAHRSRLTFSALAPKAPLNSQEMVFMKNYIRKSESNLVIIKHRSAAPFTIIDSVFRVYGLPLQLKYLAVIESELKPSATSHVGALGPWQLMPGTARILGLKTFPKADERKNYYKSTQAAARYLKDLYAQFGDWLLVIAAYNGGPKPVCSAIDRSGSRNFWTLQRFLPQETRQHVKKFIATNYYFEGRGSLTTLTRSEAIQYKKTLNAFAISHEEKATAKETSKKHSESADEKTMSKEPSEKSSESADEKFERLMKTSANLLKSSNQLLVKSRL